MAIAAVAALSVACEDAGGGAGSGAGGGAGSPTVTGGGGPNQGGAGGSSDASPGGHATTPGGTGETSPVETPGSPTDDRPVVGNVELSPQNLECSYVPHGNLDGSDGLTVMVYVLLIGTNSLPRPLSNAVAFSNGFTTTYTGHPNNQAAAAYQGPIRQGDWGHRLTVRITADANDQYRESSESDNTIEVAVDLPSNRLDRSVSPLPCTASRA